MVISGRIPTCDRVHSWWYYSAASLGHQATGTMTCYPTQSLYPDIEPTSPWPILIMPSTRLESDKYRFYSFWFGSTKFRTHKLWVRTCDLRIPKSPSKGGGLIGPPRLLWVAARSTHLCAPFSYLRLGTKPYAVAPYMEATQLLCGVVFKVLSPYAIFKKRNIVQ